MFSGVWKPLYKYVVLGVICPLNDYPMWRLNDTQVNIGELWTLLGVHREVIVEHIKEVLEEFGAGVDTQ